MIRAFLAHTKYHPCRISGEQDANHNTQGSQPEKENDYVEPRKPILFWSWPDAVAQEPIQADGTKQDNAKATNGARPVTGFFSASTQPKKAPVPISGPKPFKGHITRVQPKPERGQSHIAKPAPVILMTATYPNCYVDADCSKRVTGQVCRNSEQLLVFCDSLVLKVFFRLT